MIVTIRGTEFACRTATVEEGKVTLFLGEYDEHGEERTSVFIGFDPMEIQGVEETAVPTLDERVTTLETDTADMAEALDMILAGVTE